MDADFFECLNPSEVVLQEEDVSIQVGRQLVVLIDEVPDGRIIARGPGDAPEVDGQVIIDGSWEDVGPGDFIEVQVSGYDQLDLFAEPL